MSDPLVTVHEGTLRGQIKSDFYGENFYSFQGIPYAKPPLGKLRFKAPQPPEKWEGVRDALEEAEECYGKHSSECYGSEDCLYLNVFTKQITGKELKPVMVWIHGGGFTSGSSKTALYGPEYLITQDIVLVTLNYRLGILGFLSLEDSSLGVPGNAGLKDIVMTLQWVQKNINKFSGDPNNVTIFGESAGAAAVHYLILSPTTTGLFHKAIAQSGCALNGWVVGKRGMQYILANTLGIESNDEKTILDLFQELPVEELYEAVYKHPDPIYVGSIRPFGPVIERNSPESFLTEHPINIIKSGKYNKIPLMMGYCSREGMFVYHLCTLKKGYLLTDKTIVPYSMNLRKDGTLYKYVSNTVRQFYFNGKNPLDNRDVIYKLYRDNVFLLDIYNTARYHLETSSSPIYFYKFSLDTDLNFMKRVYSIKDPGACHADDVAYLFKNAFTPDNIKPTSPEGTGIQRMIKLWTNFAKYGDPTPNTKDKLLEVKWEPIKPKKFNFLEIGEQLEMKIDPEKNAMDFWNHLYDSLPLRASKL